MENRQLVIDLFTAVYGRSPTQSGIDFFTEKLNSREWSPINIVDFMLDVKNNPEAEVRFPSNMETTEKIETIFHNILGRGTATKEGLEFWANKVDNENYSMSDLILNVLNSAREHENDAKTLDIKSSVVKYFLDNIPKDRQAGNQPDLTEVIDEKSALDAIDKIKASSNDVKFSHTNYGLGDISTLDSTGVSSIDSTHHWDRKELTYSFNQSIPDSYYNYPEDGLTDKWHELNQAQKDAVNSITQEINSLLDIKLTKVSDSGDIRFNMIDMPQNQAGFSFYPADNPDYGGDVFLSNDFNSDPKSYGLDRGNGGWTTIVHELGHALGLKHPFENPNRLPSNQDDINHTVMSYTNKDDINPIFTIDGSTIKLEYHTLYPNLYSLYDISALQAIYGANTTTNKEDNTYTTKYSDYEIQTIWDAGGDDTIDLSTTKGRTTIDLRGGTINSIDEYSLEDIIKLHQDEVGNSQANSWIRDKITEIYNAGMLYTGKNNFSIAEGVIIENIKTGSGDDIIIDNSVDNSIYANGGDDKIYIGNGGYDYINGGTGEDTLYIDLTKDKIKLEQISSSNYILTTDNFGVKFTNIELLHFSDNTTSAPDLLIG